MNSLCLIKFLKLSSPINPLKRLYSTTKFISPSVVPKSSLLKATTPFQTQCQSFWETFPATNYSYHLKDGLSKENNTLIYRSKLFNYAFYAQFVSMSCFAVQLIYSIKYAYKTNVLGETVNLDLGPFTFTFDWLSLCIIGIFTFQNIVMFKMAQTAVLRVYHREKTDDYVLVSLALNPFKSRLVLCKPGELKDLNKHNLWAMMGNYELHGHKIFLVFEYFKTAYHFNRLIGGNI